MDLPIVDFGSKAKLIQVLVQATIALSDHHAMFCSAQQHIRDLNQRN
jgi:hypothetical protein